VPSTNSTFRRSNPPWLELEIWLKLLLVFMVVVAVDYYWTDYTVTCAGAGAGPVPPVKRKAVMGGRQSPRAFIELYTIGPALVAWPMAMSVRGIMGKAAKKRHSWSPISLTQ
jgi:hypothetical protein